MESSEMFRLIGAAESQGFIVTTRGKGQAVTFEMPSLYSDGVWRNLVVVIAQTSSFENALDRLRRLGLIWLSPE